MPTVGLATYVPTMEKTGKLPRYGCRSSRCAAHTIVEYSKGVTFCTKGISTYPTSSDPTCPIGMIWRQMPCNLARNFIVLDPPQPLFAGG